MTYICKKTNTLCKESNCNDYQITSDNLLIKTIRTLAFHISKNKQAIEEFVNYIEIVKNRCSESETVRDNVILEITNTCMDDDDVYQKTLGSDKTAPPIPDDCYANKIITNMNINALQYDLYPYHTENKLLDDISNKCFTVYVHVILFNKNDELIHLVDELKHLKTQNLCPYGIDINDDKCKKYVVRADETLFHIITQAPIGTVLTIIQQVKDMDINMRTVSDIEEVIIKLDNLGYPSYYQKLSVIDL